MIYSVHMDTRTSGLGNGKLQAIFNEASEKLAGEIYSNMHRVYDDLHEEIKPEKFDSFRKYIARKKDGNNETRKRNTNSRFDLNITKSVYCVYKTLKILGKSHDWLFDEEKTDDQSSIKNKIDYIIQRLDSEPSKIDTVNDRIDLLIEEARPKLKMNMSQKYGYIMYFFNYVQDIVLAKGEEVLKKEKNNAPEQDIQNFEFACMQLIVSSRNMFRTNNPTTRIVNKYFNNNKNELDNYSVLSSYMLFIILFFCVLLSTYIESYRMAMKKQLLASGCDDEKTILEKLRKTAAVCAELLRIIIDTPSNELDSMETFYHRIYMIIKDFFSKNVFTDSILSIRDKVFDDALKEYLSFRKQKITLSDYFIVRIPKSFGENMDCLEQGIEKLALDLDKQLINGKR